MESVLCRIRREGTLILGEWLEQESQQRKLRKDWAFDVGGRAGDCGNTPKEETILKRRKQSALSNVTERSNNMRIERFLFISDIGYPGLASQNEVGC